MILRSGKTVELTDGRFLRIKSVWQNTQTTEVFLTGALIWRARMLDGLSSPNCNETCWVRDKIMDDPLRIDEIPLASVLRIRQLRMTDRPYDDFNVTHTLEIATPYATVRDQGILFCRYKHVRIYTTHAQRGHRGNSHFIEKSIVGLRHDEADPEWRSNELERGRRSVSTTTLVGDNEVRGKFL